MRLLVPLICFSLAAAVPPQVPPPSASAVDLASRLVAQPGAAERQALLAQNGTAIDVGLLRALVSEALRRIDRAEFDRAIVAYELVIDLAGRLGDRVNLASAFIGLGSVHGRRGDYPAASERLRAGLAVAEELDDVERVDAALHNLGVVYRLQGEYEQALAYYGRVVALAERTDRVHVLGPTYNNIGIVHTLRGSYRDALDALHRSLALKEAAGDEAGLRSTLTNIGNVHVQQGHAELALDYYRRSLDVADRLAPARRAATLNDIGQAYADLGRQDLAIEHFERALILHEAAGQKAEIATTLFNLGRAHAVRGDADAARDLHARSLAIREAINDRPGVAQSLVAMAELALARDEAAAALDLADRAARLARETGSRESFWQGRLVAGRSHESRGALDAARGAYEDAIDTIEALRGDVAGGARNRQRYFERKLDPYHRLVGLLLARDLPDDALAVAERARARALFDVLSEGPAERRLLTSDERARERALERRLSDLRSDLWAEEARAQPDASVAARLQGEIRAARLAHGDLRASLYAAHPALRLQRGDTAPGSVDAAAALIGDPRTALLEFVVTEEATCLFVLTRAGDEAARRIQTAVFRLDLPRDRLAALVEGFRRQLQSRDLRFQQTARAVYDAVLGPADAALRGRTDLIVVPDGALWALPFQALRPSWGGYLIEHASVSYAPSIGVLGELRARRRARHAGSPPRLLALGDPELRLATGVERPAGAAVFPPLPDAVRQVRALSQLYGPGGSDVFVGGAASERTLRSELGEASVLHFATHGIVDNAGPMYSFLLLSGDPDAGAADDGRLEAWEVADMHLPVEAVVVAACETALGRVGPGEGMIGLSWAFFLAGSPRTVASLWKVDAASTTDLMVSFHGRFRQGLIDNPAEPGAAASLREAALSLLRSERYRHPFYWAGFILVGDSQ